MASTPFSLTLAISSDRAPAALLEELAAHVLKQVGGPADAAAQLSAALKQASDAGAFTAGRCDLTCVSHGTSIDIQVTADGTPVWQASCATP